MKSITFDNETDRVTLANGDEQRSMQTYEFTMDLTEAFKFLGIQGVEIFTFGEEA